MEIRFTSNGMSPRQALEQLRALDSDFVRRLLDSAEEAAKEGSRDGFVFTTGAAATQVLKERGEL